MAPPSDARHSELRPYTTRPSGCSRRAICELDEAGLRFIAGSRATKAPVNLASHFRWHDTAFTDPVFQWDHASSVNVDDTR
jgi:hypothetical protein